MNIHQFNAHTICSMQDDWTLRWHEQIQLTPFEPLLKSIENNHEQNFRLWHEEDVVRTPLIDPLDVCAAKRDIDRYNQKRNDAMENIDEWFAVQLRGLDAGNSPLHSETPGMMIDRLSILSLKAFHMNEEALRLTASEEHRQGCVGKTWALKTQRADLRACLDVLVAQLREGNRQFRVYRQFKMYNDAEMNPQIHGGK